jgi:hypothetical protein
MRGLQSDKSQFHQIKWAIKEREHTKQEEQKPKQVGRKKAESERTTHNAPDTETQHGFVVTDKDN